MKKIVKTSIAMTLSLLCLFSNSAVKAQTKENNKPNFKKSQIQLSFSAMAYQGLKIEPLAGNDYLKAFPTPSGRLGIAYSQYLTKGFSLDFGVGLSTLPWGISYDFEVAPSDFLAQREEKVSLFLRNMSIGNQYVYDFSISAKRYFQYKESKYLDIGVGISYYQVTDFLYDLGEGKQFDNDPSSPYNRVVLFDMGFRSGFVDHITAMFTIGKYKITKKQNTVGWHFIANWALGSIGYGDFGNYEFPELAEETRGTIEPRLSNIAIRFSYVFFVGKKR